MIGGNLAEGNEERSWREPGITHNLASGLADSAVYGMERLEVFDLRLPFGDGQQEGNSLEWRFRGGAAREEVM